MNGAESLLATMAASGVGVCFANPGTTEMALVRALDAVRGIRGVLGLFEGVCSGAADGYARMAGRPAMGLFHLGPGFANAVANLHNARRARSPVVNVVGDQATWHREADAPLTSDIASLARPVSRWVRAATSARALAQDAAEAVAAATGEGGCVATLIVPSDCQTGEAGGPVQPIAGEPRRAVPGGRVEEVAAALRGRSRAALVLGGQALLERGQRAAARVAGATGCRMLSECFPARQERGAGFPRIERVPYFPERALASLAGLEILVLAGAAEPVAFFGHPGIPSRLAPAGCALLTLASPEEDVEGALEALAEALAARDPAVAPVRRVDMPADGPLTPDAVGAVLALSQPEGAIVVEESGTTGLRYFGPAAASPRHTLLTLTGGSIGMGPPCAVGAAIACPDRVVVAFQGDGGAMYTLQALWTQAREQLHVVTLLCANRRYRILEVELARAGGAAGPQALGLTDLSRPPLDWVSLARGMGVPGTRVETVASLREALGRGLAEAGPHLVEMAVA